MNSLRAVILLLCLVPTLTSLPLTAANSGPSDRPNLLIIMADDCTYNDLPMYGGRNAKTPNLEQFATQGMTFTRAYLASAMCQPCRAELFSGRYPMSNGCAWNHSGSLAGLRTMPQRLRDLGYRVGLAGKLHVSPRSSFPFEKVEGFDPNCVRNPTRQHEMAGIHDFMTRSSDPFCLVVALVEPHVPWVMGDASQYPPKSIELPPNIADTPRTREDFARYLAEITYMDGQVGEILTTLEATGRSESTLVVFTSEQGSQFPGNKWTNWNTGIHTALMARWPGHIRPDSRTEALVQYCDLLPTFLHAAGHPQAASGLDGRSFLPVMTGESSEHRRYVYGSHNNLPEGPAYPIRSISDGEWHLLLNLLPDELYIEKHLMGSKGDGALNNPYWATWIWQSQQDAETYQLVRRYMHRPAVQLYHTATDPYELADRVNDADVAEIRQQLEEQLRSWMDLQGDPGASQDTMEALQAARKAAHLYGPHVGNQ